MMIKKIFPARFDQLDAIREFINNATSEAGMDEPGRCAVEMAVDEACSNIVEHAYEGVENGEIECKCKTDEKVFSIILRDHGAPFDMKAVPLPDIANALEERKVGGLGVFLIHELMDDVKYERKGELGNILTLKRNIQREK